MEKSMRRAIMGWVIQLKGIQNQMKQREVDLCAVSRVTRAKQNRVAAPLLLMKALWDAMVAMSIFFT